MKVLLDINDKNVPFVMELLRNLPFVKAKELTRTKAKFLEDLAESVYDVKRSKEGKMKLKNLNQLLDEL